VVTGLAEKIGDIPPVYDQEKAARSLRELLGIVEADKSLAGLAKILKPPGRARDLISSVFGASPYLTRVILRDAATLQDCLSNDPEKYLEALAASLESEIAGTDSMEEAMGRLRRYKRKVALLAALADVGSVWPTMETAAALSQAADLTLTCAVRFLLRRAAAAGDLFPSDPARPETNCGYFVIGMGKLGAGELNYSSDVDLIVFYDLERIPLRDGLEPSPFFVRLTRDLIRMMQERTEDDYVFRTDLRLRPDPGATQVALSTDAGFTYYESFGQNWERAALIKARVVAGDREAGESFLAQLAPFVWRKYLDYAAIADIHAMKRRVHAFKGHGKVAVAGHDIKLGRGGIREIEFFAQTQQLVSGGRQIELRIRPTLAALAKLADQGWITQQVADELSDAYRFLRHVEHRLQMIADEQTHRLPADEAGLDRVARFSGFATTGAFAETLIGHLSKVQEHYGGLFVDIPELPEMAQELSIQGDDDDQAQLGALEEIGFQNPAAVVSTVRAWRSGRYAATRSERARERLNEFLPHLLEALGATAQPDHALATFDRFLAGLPTGVQLFSLFRSNPSLLRLIADIMGIAPRLASVLSHRSRVLDAVLDPGFFGDLPSPVELGGLVAREVGEAGDYQERLDLARIVGHEQAFLIGVRILSGSVTADQAGGAYAQLAEALVRTLHGAVERELDGAHGAIEGGEAAVLAVGKLGGREMTAASDLDLIVVYDFPDDAAMSDGGKPLSGSQYYMRLTQRLISALSAPTAEGTLYEVDMRLRPSGNSGPVATRLESFVDYQRTQAWTWEHLALTRARVISGPQRLRDAIEATISDVLAMPRKRAGVARDVHEMRGKIETEKGTSNIWHLKQVRGGLVDLEFIAQFLQLVSANEHGEVLDQNTAAAIEKLAQAGVLDASDADILRPAARLYHNLTQVLRLCLDRPFDPSEAPDGLKKLLSDAAGLPDFNTLEAHLRETLEAVHSAFDRLIR
jgi:glutamate-ammonia-ligase adenylyltransferase